MCVGGQNADYNDVSNSITNESHNHNREDRKGSNVNFQSRNLNKS